MGRLKQVILIRKDLRMRRGKEIAQGSHASMQFLAQAIRHGSADAGTASVELGPAERQWLFEGMAKVCLQVQSEEELVACHDKARKLGLRSHLVRDSGRTEFGGVPTLTACAIGPAPVENLDEVTGQLTLY